MGKRTTLICSDCEAEWIYENSRPQGGGALPRRCPGCAAVHRERIRTAYVGTHTQNAKRWRLANPEKMKAARAAWEQDHPERRREYRREGKRKSPELNRSYVRRRTARKRGLATVPFTPSQLRGRLRYYGNRCWMCGGLGEVIDHVKPLSKGGAHILCNLRPACHECNTLKGARWPFPTSSSCSPSRQPARIA